MRGALALALLAGCASSAPRATTSASSAVSAGDEDTPPASALAVQPSDALRDATLPNVCGDGTVTVSGGVGTYPSPLAETVDEEAGEIAIDAELEVTPIGAADLDGDGSIEWMAIVVCRPGGSGTFDALYAFHAEGESYSVFTQVLGGDRADGGIDNARLEEGYLVIERNSGTDEGLCCPTHVSTERWRLAEHAFRQVSASPPRPR